MAIDRGRGFKIRATIDGGGTPVAFQYLRPFAYVYRHGQGAADVTRIDDAYTRYTARWKDPGTITVAFFWESSEAAPPTIVAGSVLTNIVLTVSASKTITASGGHVESVDFGGSKAAERRSTGSMTIRCSGSVTVTGQTGFGPPYTGGSGDTYNYELRGGSHTSSTDYSTARRRIHVTNHAPSLSDRYIIDAMEMAGADSNFPNSSVAGSSLLLYEPHPVTPALFVTSRTVVDRINPYESIVEVVYRTSDRSWGAPPGTPIQGAFAASRSEPLGVSLWEVVPGAAGQPSDVVAVRGPAGEPMRGVHYWQERVLLIDENEAQIADLIVASRDQKGRLFVSPADDVAGVNTPFYVLDDTTIAPLGLNRWLVTYVWKTLLRFEALVPETNCPANYIAVPLVPQMHAIYQSQDGTTYSYTVVPPWEVYPVGDATGLLGTTFFGVNPV